MKSLKLMAMGCVLSTVAVVACAQAPAAAQPEGDDAVVARIGDDVITAAELEVMVGPSLVKLRQEIYDAKVAALIADDDDLVTYVGRLEAMIDEMADEPDGDDIGDLAGTVIAQCPVVFHAGDPRVRQTIGLLRIDDELPNGPVLKIDVPQETVDPGE